MFLLNRRNSMEISFVDYVYDQIQDLPTDDDTHRKYLNNYNEMTRHLIPAYNDSDVYLDHFVIMKHNDIVDSNPINCDTNDDDNNSIRTITISSDDSSSDNNDDDDFE
ncbi:unnamed protein product [Adineta steineri]|uniref:Uncharacterized protein n=1 Tax=Adineta steineri TaxID=433720 RepID=A0A815UMP1_9BILA|nr:unnamed protein product [Adineta steineri]CAF4238980.1 unnamed protein product [Adineta steineri]